MMRDETNPFKDGHMVGLHEIDLDASKAERERRLARLDSFCQRG